MCPGPTRRLDSVWLRLPQLSMPRPARQIFSVHSLRWTLALPPYDQLGHLDEMSSDWEFFRVRFPARFLKA
jgi:hypothetical protein